MEETTYILTAELDPETFAWLDSLRRRHFPPERNLIPAHLTMFHRLSSAQKGHLDGFSLARGSLPVLFDAPILLGFGVAIMVRSPQLLRLRADARQMMGGEYSRQDSHCWRPHVTIQNKVSAETAKALHATLNDAFEPRAGAVAGLLMWQYLGGPWKLARRLPI